jgi:hypothetical protein
MTELKQVKKRGVFALWIRGFSNKGASMVKKIAFIIVFLFLLGSDRTHYIQYRFVTKYALLQSWRQLWVFGTMSAISDAWILL